MLKFPSKFATANKLTLLVDKQFSAIPTKALITTNHALKVFGQSENVYNDNEV